MEQPKKLAVYTPVMQQVKIVLFPRWCTSNWLLLAIPAAIGLHYSGNNPLASYIVSSAAIIPLSIILGFAIEQIALHISEYWGAILNVALGNTVVLIIATYALAHKEIIIVQSALIGSMLVNVLLTVGLAFVFGGIARVEQYFDPTIAQFATHLLVFAITGILIPSAFTWGQSGANPDGNLDEVLSRGTSFFLLLMYVAYLIFQLTSHKEMYNTPSRSSQRRRNHNSAKKAQSEAKQGLLRRRVIGVREETGQRQHEYDLYNINPDPKLTIYGALCVLCASIGLLGLCTLILMESVNGLICEYHISQYFVGLILLPLTGNVAEFTTATSVAARDKMNLAVGLAIGSSTQIALLVLPLMVIFGWIIGSDMTLVTGDFQLVVLLLSALMVNYFTADGKAHWLEGSALIILYLIIALAAWYYPQTDGNC